jgi:proteasome accessory factor C
MRRLLLLLPWLMERGGATVEEAAARFDVTEQELVRDLELAACCGLPPYLDELIDVIVDDGQIHVGIPRLFTRPLRLTPNEGFALLAAGQAALQLPGAEPDGPLARALAKLAAVLADRPNVAVDLERPPLLELVQEAVERGERLAISYYAAARDELTERTIDPHRTFVDRGRWYVVADDPAAGGQRTFRVDRIEAASVTGEPFERRPVTPPTETGWFADSPEVRRVTLVVPASGAWVAEAYPLDEAEPLADGRVRVVLPVVSDRWLARLLLRTGPGTEVLDPPELADVGREAATRLLARYRS